MKNFTHRIFLFVLLLMLGNSCILTLQAQDCPPPTIQVFELSNSGTAIHAAWSTVPNALSYDLTFSLDGTVLFSTTTTSTTYDWTLPADWATTWSNNNSLTLSITTNCEMGVESQTAASISELTEVLKGYITATVQPVDKMNQASSTCACAGNATYIAEIGKKGGYTFYDKNRYCNGMKNPVQLLTSIQLLPICTTSSPFSISGK